MKRVYKRVSINKFNYMVLKNYWSVPSNPTKYSNVFIIKFYSINLETAKKVAYLKVYPTKAKYYVLKELL